MRSAGVRIGEQLSVRARLAGAGAGTGRAARAPLLAPCAAQSSSGRVARLRGRHRVCRRGASLRPMAVRRQRHHRHRGL